MLHLVFKSTKFWAGAFVWMLFAALCVLGGPSHALTATATVGVDYWHVPEASARYLPNYSLPEGKDWHPVSQWMRGTVQHQIDTPFMPVVLTAQGQYNTVMGGRVDRLDVAMRVTDNTGVRVGVLPYKVSWCRTYEATNPWLAEPDAFCRFHGLNEIAQGAFGAQAYHSTVAQGWLLDTMVGVYLPEVDGQANALGPYVRVGPNTLHRKVGASVNALHLATGIQTRAAWLNTQQNQASDTGSYERRLDFDTYYLAAEGNVTPTLNLRGSVAAYIGDQTNPANTYAWNGRSTTIEAIYKPLPGHSIALGVSKYTNVTTYAKPPNNQRLDVPSLSLAWRTEWPDGVHTVVQATRTVDDSTSRQGVLTARDGNAIGMRLAKTF